jgi:hypothetical protein
MTTRAQLRTLDLVSPDDIATRLEVKPQTVATWRARFADFPRPWLRCSRVDIFRWAEVEHWADVHGRRVEVRRGECTAEELALATAHLSEVRAQLAREVRRAADDVADLLDESLRRPAERATVRDGRGRIRSSDGRGNGVGEWDSWFQLSNADRLRLSRHLSDSPSALAPDQYASAMVGRLGPVDPETALAAWIDAANLSDAAAMLERGKVPDFDIPPCTTYDVRAIFGRDGALELARAWHAAREDEEWREERADAPREFAELEAF